MNCPQASLFDLDDGDVIFNTDAFCAFGDEGWHRHGLLLMLMWLL